MFDKRSTKLQQTEYSRSFVTIPSNFIKKLKWVKGQELIIELVEDEIIIKTNSSNITKNSFTLLFTLIKGDDAVLISLGKQEISFRNSKTGEIVDLPKPLVENIFRPIEVDEKSMLFNF